jgi:FixJ family two-component response regulator
MIDQPPYTHDGIGVSLVDGDPVIRRARQIMLVSERYDVRSYATCAALLADPRSRDVSCIVVDVAGDGEEGSGEEGGGIAALHAMRATGWRGKAILLDSGSPLPALVHAAERHGDRILDRTTGDAPLLTAIAASIDRGWSTWNAEG